MSISMSNVHFRTWEFNEFGLRNENVLRVKVGYFNMFKKQCLANCDKMLNLAKYQYSKGQPVWTIENFVNIFTV